jgi:hypothetical protein
MIDENTGLMVVRSDTIFARFDSPLSRSVLFKSEMGSVRVVIANIRPDNAPKLAVIDPDHMIQAVPS